MSRTIRKLLGEADNVPDAPRVKTGEGAARKALAQNPNKAGHNVDTALPLSFVRNLIYSGAPEDLAQLRKIVDNMSPDEQDKLLRTITAETRNPQVAGIDPATKKPRPIELTEEGKMLVDAVFNGVDPDASWIQNKPATPGGGVRLDGIDAQAGMEPKPFQPENPSEDPKVLKDVTSNRGELGLRKGKDKDGNTVYYPKYTDENTDPQTRRAIERANEGLRVGPVYDDAANTPRGSGVNPRPPGRALAAGTQTPKQKATALMNRLAENSNAHDVIDSKRASDPLMFDTADSRQDNPSVFAPGNTGSKMKRHVTSVRPADHSDALDAFRTVKRGEFTTPNQQYSSAEEFARDFVSTTNKESMNVTPVTAGERADATELLQDYNHDPDFPVDRMNGGDIPPGQMSEKKAGPLLRQNMPDSVKAAQTAERALMMEQTIASLTRKFEDIFGHQGWGENYRPSTRPGTSDPIERGPASDGVATTQDPARVPDRNVHAIGTANRRGTPDVDGRSYDEKLTSYEQEKDAALRRIKRGDPDTGTGYFDESQPLIRTPQKPQAPLGNGRPGMEIGEGVDADDLADLHQQRVGGDGEPISTEEVDPNFALGRDLGDRRGVNSKPAKELPGNKPGSYNAVVYDEDGKKKYIPDGDRPFARYNRENRDVPQSDLDRRRLFAEEMSKKVGTEMERTSVLRRQLRELLESDEPEAPGTSAAAAKATKIAELQRRLTLAKRLDSMSGINSMQTMDREAGTLNRSFNPFPAQTGGDLIPVTPANPSSAGGSMVPGSQSAAPGGALIPSTTADLQGGKLAASTTPIDPVEVLPPRRDLDLNNEPIDAEFEIKREPDPVEVKREPDLEDVVINRPEDPSVHTPDATPQAEPQWKKWAKRAGLVGGALGIRELLIRGGQPPVGGGIEPPPPMPPMGPQGPEGFPFPYVPRGGEGSQDLGAKPEDRIRALRNFNMNLNPNTQILQNWTR